MQKYIDTISFLMLDFQLIEEALKTCIDETNKKIRIVVRGKIPFKYSRQDVGKDALGTLINKFEKINNNMRLITKLKELPPKRNNIAHKGLLFTLAEQNDKKDIALKIKKLEILRKETRAILFELLEEFKKIKQN